ncbi:hypothetical protein HNY73_002130 [Argiope bruennichi]|uniref:Uncharacterized protein n=1 Tax=Argiope bruennichi TaxID=94029 RepID=A0A8T0FV91_ARGBR|nr:hypothetical protein HNY73_002130 [Argiope bruennichi]
MFPLIKCYVIIPEVQGRLTAISGWADLPGKWGIFVSLLNIVEWNEGREGIGGLARILTERTRLAFSHMAPKGGNDA